MRSVESLKADPLHGVDSRWSWITAVSCSCMLFVATCSVRVAGVLFYGIVDTFGVTREEASWPVTLNGCMLNLAGPLMGYLCRRFSCRNVLLICSLLCGLGISLCYFAQGVLFINLCFGLLHGITLSGIFVGGNVLVSQHFEKRRNTAHSLLFTVTGLNTFAITTIVEYFRSTYGTRGAFLLLGALVFNTFPASILLRSPIWTLPIKTSSKGASQRMTTVVKQKMLSSLHADDLKPGNNIVKIRPNATAIRQMNSAKLARSSVVDDWTGSVQSFLELNGDKPSIGPHARAATLRETSKQFLTPSFVVIALSFSVVVFGMATFILLSVDLAKDKGIVPSEAIYLLHAFTAGDIAFRALTGFVIDSGFLSLEAVMLLGYLVQGFAYELLVWSETLPMMLLCSVLVGVSNGSRISLQAPSIIKSFGMDTLPIMMGGMVFCIGAFTLGRPALVGYFRDQLGDYRGLLHIIAIVNAVFFLVWTLRLLLQRRKQSRVEDPENEDKPCDKTENLLEGDNS
ncbi:unnamed protein product [Ixodes persulcatus]